MKEATGEVSMTVVTLVAIGVIGAILALFWPRIQEKIGGLWGADCANPGEYRDPNTGQCVTPTAP